MEKTTETKSHQVNLRSPLTTKKRGYPSVFKSAGIAQKSAGIGSKFLSRHFFSRRFKPPGNECGYRVARPEKRWERHTPYISAFESASIGSKNAGIGYIRIFIKAVLTQVKMPDQGLKVPGPIPAVLKSAGTGPRDPIPTFKSQRFEAPGKKTLG